MYTFKDIVDVAVLQQIADSLYEAAGIPVGIISVNNEILVATGWQDICTKFHRVHPETCKKCHESDSFIASRLHDAEYPQYKCKNNMWDIAVPIVIEGKHLATLFLGQFFYDDEVVDYDFFRNQARKYDFDEPAYMAALDRVPIFSRSQVREMIQYYHHFVKNLASQGLQNLRLTQEITAREKAEAELSKLRNLLRNVVDSMPSVLVGVDKSGSVIQWNREAELASGIEAENAVGKALADVFPRFANKIDQIKTSIREKAIQSDPRIVHQHDGKTHYESMTIYPLVTNGVEGAVIRVDDITERVRIEDLLMQSEKMMSVGGLAAGMAHEINNPLAAIIGSVQTVTRRLGTDLAANHTVANECGTDMESVSAYLEKRKVLELLNGVHDAGCRAAQIITNMLAFSRRSSSEFTYCSIPELLENTIELAATDYDLRKAYDFKKVAIERDFSEVPTVYCQKGLLQQVFFNLLSNGAQAMSDKEYVGGEKPKLSLTVRNLGDQVRIAIEDNGPGISEEIRNRVFEPFFTTKPVGQGTGLGLSVSYFIITEEHGGQFCIESEEGQWARFIITLPIHKQQFTGHGSSMYNMH